MALALREQQHDFLNACKNFKAEDFKQRIQKFLNENPQLVNAQPTKENTEERRWSALHQAAFSGDIEFVNTIISYGGDWFLVNDDGETPIQLLKSILTDMRKEEAELDLTREVLGDLSHKERLLSGEMELIRALTPHPVERLAQTFFVTITPGDVVISDEARKALLTAWLGTKEQATLKDVTDEINKIYEERREEFFNKTPVSLRWLAPIVCWKFQIEKGDVIQLLREDFKTDEKKDCLYYLAAGLALMCPARGMRIACNYRVKRFFRELRGAGGCRSCRCLERARSTIKPASTFYLTLFGYVIASYLVRSIGSFTLIYYILKGLLRISLSGLSKVDLWDGVGVACAIMVLFILVSLSETLSCYRDTMSPRIPLLWVRLYRSSARNGNGLNEAFLERDDSVV